MKTIYRAPQHDSRRLGSNPADEAKIVKPQCVALRLNYFTPKGISIFLIHHAHKENMSCSL